MIKDIIRDIDGDGKNEILFVDKKKGEIRCLSYEGALKWETCISPFIKDVDIKDINNDGIEEIIVIGNNGEVEWLSGKEGTLFGPEDIKTSWKGQWRKLLQQIKLHPIIKIILVLGAIISIIKFSGTLLFLL